MAKGKWKEKKEVCGLKLGRRPTLDDVANCISLIPESIDTKGTRKVREYLDEKEIEPTRYYPKMYQEKPVSETDLVTKGKKGIADDLMEIKSTLRWQLNDAPYTYIGVCGQEMVRGTIDGEERLVGAKTDHKGVCTVKNDDILKMRELSNEIRDEDWDISLMAEEIGNELFKDWKYDSAWDLSDEEASLLYTDVIETKKQEG